MFRSKAALSLILALTVLTSQNFFSSAASYSRTSLQDMTQRAVAVAEVRVLSRSYPASAANEFQRTSVEVAIQKTLKGKLPETLTLDLPGGLRGNQVYFVADSAEFQIGERAMVFIKEPVAGQYMVQDLGLGKFNIVERNGATFVESALCPKAMETSSGKADADLLTKSIPYNDFCTMVSSYATNGEPTVSPIKLAMTLQNSGSHVCEVNKPCIAAIDGAMLKDAAKKSHEAWNFGFGCVFMALCAATVVYVRRKNAQKMPVRASIKSIALVLTASLLAGAALGGSYSMAYVASGPIWNLDDTNNPTKVQSGKIVWKQSVQGSKTNSNCFNDVTASFTKWSSLTNCRLAFVNAGTTPNTTHSSNDNVNLVVWDPNPSSDFSSSTLGITYSVYTLGTVSNFIDSDIVFNDRDFNWAPGSSGNTNSVSLHEIGHFVGLAHTSDATCVMYPIDHGFLQLSKDEVLAAQTLYAGKSNNVTPPPPATTPPTAVASGSPLTGPAPLNCGLDASASAAGTNPIASYAWNFGDGATASGKTSAHTYTTAGTYTATVTVTDTKGVSSSASVTVTVEGSGTPVKGSFKLLFTTSGRDSFCATILSTDIASYNPGTTVVNGTVTVAGMDFPFTYDPVSRKSYGTNGMKLNVSTKTGTITIAIKNASLQAALSSTGAKNETASGTTVTVPVNVVFGNGAQLALYNQIGFTYFAVANKAGAGKY